MENDYYLHNFQGVNSDQLISHMQQLYAAPADSTLALAGSGPNSRIPWWKMALLSHLKTRLWKNSKELFNEDALPPRFDRIYQPEKIGYFDSIFSRDWETPHRRDHSSQHSVQDEGAAFVRIVTRDGESQRVDNMSSEGDEGCTIQKVNENGSSFAEAPAVSLFSGYFAKQRPKARSSYVGYDAQHEAVKPEYLKYCSKSSRPSGYFAQEKVDEFKKALRETTMQADDVAGIREVRLHIS